MTTKPITLITDARQRGVTAVQGPGTAPPQSIGELGVIGCEGGLQLFEQPLFVL